MGNALAVAILPPLPAAGSGAPAIVPHAAKSARPRFSASPPDPEGDHGRRTEAGIWREEPRSRPNRLRLVAFDAGDAGDGVAFGAFSSLAFLAQHFAQERMPNGLTLEPWGAAAGAYSYGPRPAASIDIAA
jgi:hypothetical protein